MTAFVKAYIFNNLGDDLFIRTLSQRYKNTNFFLFANPKYKKGFQDLKNIIFPSTLAWMLFRALRKFNLLRFINLERVCEKKCDIVVMIGGSLFIEQLNYKSVKIEKYKKESYLIGANFGPYFTKKYFENHKILFSSINDVCFRDSYSWRLYKDLGNVRWAPDILFGYDVSKYTAESSSGICISLISLDKRNDLLKFKELYYNMISDVINNANKDGVNVTILSFCQFESDEAAIDEINRRVEASTKYKILKYRGENLEQVLLEIASHDVIVATRFHAMILGWILNKRVLPVIYSDKQRHVLDDMNYKGPLYDIRCGGELNSDLYNLCYKTERINIEEEKKASEKHFMFLDKALLNS